MTVKSKVLAGAATLTLVCGAGLAGAGTASAATPSCGASCINIYSQQFGTSGSPSFVLDTFRQGEKTGQPIIMFRTANYDPAEDFTVADQGNVSDFYAAGLVSAEVNLHYGCSSVANVCAAGTSYPDEPAFEAEYAPFGVESGLCAGVAKTAFQGEGVTLQPCGTGPDTVWIADLPLRAGQTADSCPATNNLYLNEIPVINGSDTNFSNPFVLTYPENAYPTDEPRPQLTVTNLTGFSQTGNGTPCGGGNVAGPDTSQLFSAVTGVLP
jgi:hypothetical protein